MSDTTAFVILMIFFGVSVFAGAVLDRIYPEPAPQCCPCVEVEP